MGLTHIYLLPAPKVPKPTKTEAPTKKKHEEEDVEEEDEEEEEEEEEEAEEDDDEKDEAAAATKTEEDKKKKKKKAALKKKFSASEFFGGEGGAVFDDRNHRMVKKITINSGFIVQSIEITYEADISVKHGGNGGKEHSLELGKDEYVNTVIVRHTNMIQCLTFITNKGNKLEAGGKGRPILDKKGDETQIKAPLGLKLCGIMGRAGAGLDAIAFRWGP